MTTDAAAVPGAPVVPPAGDGSRVEGPTGTAPAPGHGSRPEPGPRTAAVVTTSDSAAAGRAAETSGPLAAALLSALGWTVSAPQVVPDEIEEISAAVAGAIRAGARLVVTTGGTGAGPRDVTPEALRGMGVRELPGLGEAIRAASRSRVPTADLSRSLGGILDGAVVLALPGSPGGVRDGLTAVGGLLAHAVEIAGGGGHPHDGRTRTGQGGEPAPPAVSGSARRTQADAVSSLRSPKPTDPAEPAEAVSCVGSPTATDPVDLADATGPMSRQDLSTPPGYRGRQDLAGAGNAATTDDSAGPVAAAPAADSAEPLVGPDPIDPVALSVAVGQDSAGAVVSFLGVVRDHDHGRAVVALEYEAHPSAGHVMAAVLAEARTRPGVLDVAARHRVGALAVGDVAFAAAVAAAHRAEAFAACAWLVDEVKARLPVWKHQWFADGSDEWVNCA